MRTITVSDDIWRRLTYKKLELECETISDVINLILIKTGDKNENKFNSRP